MTSTKKATQTAAAEAAYAANQAEAADLLKRIANRLEQNAQATTTKDWADAGSLAHVNEELAFVLAFLGDRSAVDAKGLEY